MQAISVIQIPPNKTLLAHIKDIRYGSLLAHTHDLQQASLKLSQNKFFSAFGLDLITILKLKNTDFNVRE